MSILSEKRFVNTAKNDEAVKSRKAAAIKAKEDAKRKESENQKEAEKEKRYEGMTAFQRDRAEKADKERGKKQADSVNEHFQTMVKDLKKMGKEQVLEHMEGVEVIEGIAYPIIELDNPPSWWTTDGWNDEVVRQESVRGYEDWHPFYVAATKDIKAIINYGVIYDGKKVNVPELNSAPLKITMNGGGLNELTLTSTDKFIWVEFVHPYKVVVNSEDSDSDFKGWLVAEVIDGVVTQHLKSDIFIGGVSSESPFTVEVRKDPVTDKPIAFVKEGFIFASDLTFEDPTVLGDLQLITEIKKDDYIAIKQTISSEGVSSYELVIIDDTDDLIKTAIDNYYAEYTHHIIAKIIEDPDSSETTKPLIAEQYITTNLVRVSSTHSGVSYYRLLPR